MVHRNPSSLRRCSILAIGACIGLISTGCTGAAADAAAAGALNFIQGGVSTLLSSVIFGDDALSAMDGMAMDGMDMDGMDMDGMDMNGTMMSGGSNGG